MNAIERARRRDRLAREIRLRLLTSSEQEAQKLEREFRRIVTDAAEDRKE